MVRLRLPGGRIDAAVLRRLAELAVAYGNGILQLTSRSGLQIRGLPDPLPAAFVDEVVASGVLPTTTHERVRNIVASPLTGMAGGLADLSGMTAELDAELTAVPALADLPGRFLFVLDDGRGDVIDLRFDLGYQASGPDGGYLLVGSAEQGLPVRSAEVVPTLLRLAEQFAAARPAAGAWHVSELPDWVATLDLQPVQPCRGVPATALGRVGDAASVLVPLARLTLEHAQLVADLVAGSSDHEKNTVVITPWRGLVLPAAADHLDELVGVGLVADEESAWSQVSACVGAPYCGRARVDTTEIARALVADGRTLPRIHVAGCDRRCGAPTGDHLDLVAPTVTQALAATGVADGLDPRS